MAITKRTCEKKGGEIIEEDGTEYCKISISNRVLSPKMIAHQERFKQAAKNCKGKPEYRVCMSSEMKKR